jgi:hypothetical protein
VETEVRDHVARRTNAALLSPAIELRYRIVADHAGFADYEYPVWDIQLGGISTPIEIDLEPILGFERH